MKDDDRRDCVSVDLDRKEAVAVELGKMACRKMDFHADYDDCSNDSASTVSNVDIDAADVDVKDVKRQTDQGADREEADDDDDVEEQEREALIDEILKEIGLTNRQLHYSKRAQLRQLLIEEDRKPSWVSGSEMAEGVNGGAEKEGNDDETKPQRQQQQSNASDPMLEKRRRRRVVAEAFLSEIVSKSRRLDAVIESVEGTASLDGVNRSKLKQKLKKRVLEGDDDDDLRELVEEFVEEVQSHTSAFEVEPINGEAYMGDYRNGVFSHHYAIVSLILRCLFSETLLSTAVCSPHLISLVFP